MDKQTLTPRQEQALKIIAAKQATRRTGPSVREVAAAMGVAGNAVQGFVGKLRAAGAIEADSGYGLVLSSAGVRTSTRKPLAKPGGKLL